jgi:hypothetical protein
MKNKPLDFPEEFSFQAAASGIDPCRGLPGTPGTTFWHHDDN